MGMHKYISRIRTKTGKWRYIYRNADSSGKGGQSDGHSNKTESLNPSDDSKKGIRYRVKKKLGRKFKRPKATQLPRPAMDTFKRPRLKRLWRGGRVKNKKRRR